MNLNPGIADKPVIKGRKKVSRKKIIISLVLILIVTTIIGVSYYKSKNTDKRAVQQPTVPVMRGDLSVVISGSAPISSSKKYDFTSNVNGTLIRINARDGDKIKAGDLIFEIDDKDTQLHIKQLKNSIAQAQLTYESNKKDLLASTVTAPIDGEVSDIQVKVGDNLQSNGILLTITDKSKLKLLVPFSNTYRDRLTTGQQAQINVFDTTKEELYRVTGIIDSVSSPSYTTAEGSEVYNVSIIIENQSSLKEGMVGNAVINIDGKEIKSIESSTLSYINSVTVRTESGGKIDILNVENGQNVKKDDVLAEFSNEDLRLTVETNSLKLEDLYTQLETAQEKLLDYKIYAPFDGTFTLNDIEQGNSIKQGDILGSVANYDIMEFSINVDELDIAKIELGQKVNVTIDALEETMEKPLKGTVTKIAVEGSSSNGVSTYPVTIQIEENESLKGGMNANADIIVNQKKGVLYVPVDAVQKRNGKSYVMVASNRDNDAGAGGDKVQKQQDTEQKIERKEVKTGISTADYIEITGGLNEGDLVVVTAAGSITNARAMPGGGMGMPMGGPPQGGGGNRRN
jgi:HlyD family secretion protein